MMVMIATIESSAARLPVNHAVERFVRQSKSRLFQFIRSRVSTTEDAEDLLQDVLFALTVNFDPADSVERVTAWIFTVARNRIIDWYRTRKSPAHAIQAWDDLDDASDLIDLLEDPDTNPEVVLNRAIFQAELTAALEELPPEQREVFIKHEIEGLSYKEIAAETGVSQSALLSRKFYAIRKLRKRLRQFEE